MKPARAKIAVALSGGVDSACAAYLLKKKGCDVFGISMKISDGKPIGASKKICDALEIPFYSFDFTEEFENFVVKKFIDDYKHGLTPNPCVLCNQHLKFSLLFEKAMEMKASAFATGHYARIEKSPDGFLLKKGKDAQKDQSYFLFGIPPGNLEKIIFPLGELTKKEVRKIVQSKPFGKFVREESEDLCFVKGNYRNFLKSRVKKLFLPGKIVSTDGKILGQHQGIAFYTIGQRKGIGAHKKPFYVVKINAEKNEIVIGEEKELFKKQISVKNIRWLVKPSGRKIKADIKIRYRHQASKAEIEIFGNNAKIRFEKKVRAATPGQAAVFYKNDIVLGGGWLV